MRKQKFDCTECGSKGTVHFSPICEEDLQIIVCPVCASSLEIEDEIDEEELEFPTIDTDLD